MCFWGSHSDSRDEFIHKAGKKGWTLKRARETWDKAQERKRHPINPSAEIDRHIRGQG